MKSIDVCLSPVLYDYYAKDNSIVVMIDAIRASATICTAFMNGVDLIVPVSDIEVAREYKKKNYIIAGERDGEKIPGFDFGNSPINFSEENIKGKKLAFTTTNGTQVINLVKNGKSENIELIIGSFINISAVVNYINQQEKDILVICSAWKNTVNIEDTLYAGRLIELLIHKSNYNVLEAGNLAHKFYLNAGSSSLYDYVMDNSHRLSEKSKFLEKDFRYCLTEDITDVVPYLKANELVI